VRLVLGRYELLERIGRGGMADVFRAHDRSLERDVALKMMRPEFAGDAEFVERFHREAEAGAIDHPNIVRVLDSGASPDGQFIAMELVNGGTLRDLMRASGRVDQYAAAEIAAGIADGLEAAHIRGVLHRDLKPENVLLDTESRPKIADFGIARLAAATAITKAGELLGTPQYLAPEQMSGDVIDERADVYALGVILHEMLTGQQPTGGTTPSEIVARRLRSDPRPPARLVAIAPVMNALVLRALARDPARRFRRAADLRDALLQVRRPAAPVRAGPWVVRLRLPSVAPLVAALAVLTASIRDAANRVDRVAALRDALPTIRLPAPPRMPVVAMPRPSLAPVAAGVASWRARHGAPQRRSAAALMALLALVAAFIGGTLAFAARPTEVRPLAVATSAPAPTAAMLANTSRPSPSASAEPTAEPIAVPTLAPAAAATPAPTAVATSAPVVATEGDPAGTILAFYELISGHDYASASGMWSDRMRAIYPPQTNIWGRFDRTRSIVARSASVTSANPGSAAVAVDLIETLSDGTIRHWVGSWYLVRSGPGWLLDQPGLRPA